MSYSAPLAPEIRWYLKTRKYAKPTKTPLFRTPEPAASLPSGEEVRFDPLEVDRKIKAIEALKHTKGRWAGTPIKLTTDQVAYIIAPLFGWQVWDDEAERWVRLYREAFVEMPRKGAKSTLASAISMVLAFADGEKGAEVLLGAASKDQARACFQPLHALATSSVSLRKAGIKALSHEIKQSSTSSSIRVVSSRGELAHGTNPHGSICDELHVHRSLALLEAMESGTGARAQPLTLIITTADDGTLHTPYDQRRSLVEKVCKGVLTLPRMYAVIWAASPADDPFAESTWYKANPLYPITPSRAFMQSQADKAKGDPVAKASFQRLHLGLRQKLSEAFFDLAKWDENGALHFGEEEMEGQLCYGGLDLASTSDLTALVWLFPHSEDHGMKVIPRFWIPEEAVSALDVMTVGNASQWIAQGWITVTPGNVTDYDYIRQAILEDVARFRVHSIGFDPWNSTHLVNQLQEEGVAMEKVRQGTVSLSAPLKELSRLVKGGTAENPLVEHNNNPVLRWMADNLRPKVDSNHNIKPDKDRSKGKIDGISALVTALYVAMNSQVRYSSYETARVEAI